MMDWYEHKPAMTAGQEIRLRALEIVVKRVDPAASPEWVIDKAKKYAEYIEGLKPRTSGPFKQR